MAGKKLIELQYIYDSYLRDKGIKEKIGGIKQLLGEKPYYRKSRGMEWLTSIRDWLGGWPMEFVRENELVNFVQDNLDLKLARMLTGEGNTEFLFAKGETWLDPIFTNRRHLELISPFTANDPLVWVASTPQFKNFADTASEPRRSTLLMWEDDIPLSFPHCGYQNILQFGKGRYRHWEDSVYFTASDNSNPNTNGRHYSITFDDPDILRQLRAN